MLADPADLAAYAAVTQDAAPGDAVEREQGEGAPAVERAQRVRAGLIGCFENGRVVPCMIQAMPPCGTSAMQPSDLSSKFASAT